MDEIRLDRNPPGRQASFNELALRKFGQRKVAIHHPGPRSHAAVQAQHHRHHRTGGAAGPIAAVQDPRPGNLLSQTVLTDTVIS